MYTPVNTRTFNYVLLLATLIMSLASLGCATQALTSLVKEQAKQHNQCLVKLNDIRSEHTQTQNMLSLKEQTLIKKQEELNYTKDQVEKLKSVKNSSRQVVNRLTAQQIAVIINSVGGDVSVHEDKLVTRFGDLKALVAFNPETHILFAQARFKARGNLGLVNTWNRTKTFSRAYIDTNHDLVLEADINIIAGIPPETLRIWFATLKISMMAFRKEVFKEDQSQPRELSRLQL